MNPKFRAYFDQQLEQVLAAAPPRIHQLLEEIPLLVEDYPADDVLQRVGVRRRDSLCGLYTGIPLTERSVEHWGVPSDVIHIYREGILRMARLPSGEFDDLELREQIRKTILHEFGHHHGLTEDDLGELGYD